MINLGLWFAAVLHTERWIMFNTIFGQMGQGVGVGYGNYGGQNGCQAQNAYPGHYYAQQAAMAQQQAMGAGAQMSQGSLQGISQPMRWMFDGVMVEFRDFVDLVFPEDTAEKTAFILKYSKGD